MSVEQMQESFSFVPYGTTQCLLITISTDLFSLREIFKQFLNLSTTLFESSCLTNFEF